MGLTQIVHAAVEGRVRIKITGLYRSEPLKRFLELRLAALREVRLFSINLLTGKVLILFDPGTSTPTLLTQVERIVSDFYRQSPNKPSSSPCQEGEREVRSPESLLSPPNLSTPRALRKSIRRATEQESRPWHCLSAQSVIEHFGTDRTSGLSCERVQERLKKFGPNLLPESVPRSKWRIFIEQFKSLPVALLGVATVISLATGGLVEALVILSVVAINATIGCWTESQTERIIHSLKSLVRPSALVKRDGLLQEVGVGEIVPGDLLVLRPGTYVAADARLIETSHLSVDESALTGESLPVGKETEPLGDPGLPLADRHNMVYRGTLVTGGQGLAVVVATGRYTEIGQIQMLIGASKPPQTPMERQLQRVGSQLVYLSTAICIAIFLIGLLRGYGLLPMLKLSISLAVAAVPEGLPAVATTTLALGVRNMQRHRALIRHLEAVETLGSVQTICLDKTGTLTLNRMSIKAVHVNGKTYEVSQDRLMENGKTIHPYQSDELLRLVHLSVLCNESEVFEKNGEVLVSGSATENALLSLALAVGVNIQELRARYPLVSIQHRSENRNFMMTLHRTPDPNLALLALKGNPLEVLSLCSRCLINGEEVPLSEEDRLAIEWENQRMAGEALRVLGFAFGLGKANENPSSLMNPEEADSLTDGLVWVGLIGMGDPVRPGVKELIAAFHRTGIDTIMITGDQTPTAYAIGKELNLGRDGPLEILDSTHLNQMDPDVLKALCEKVHVFSRVTPAHKLQIVHALQSAGRVVAMTGDGINDGPALKAADIGVAMGKTGTDVAREVADVVLEDDNLQTMVVAIGQGRTIYNNIQKTVRYLLATNLSEIMVMSAATLGGAGPPLNVIQLLWINLISDIFPGLGLALDPPEPDVFIQPPRDPREPILRRGDFKRIGVSAALLSAGALGAYGYGWARYGVGPRASTLAFMSLCIGQILHALSCRSDQKPLLGLGSADRGLSPNRFLNVAVGGSLALQVAIPFLPGLRRLLGVTPIGFIDAWMIGFSALWPLVIQERLKPG
ncbi:MAG: cation-transporting P-type ATPase [Desulfobacterota bacterium]|nr:cation-transporting P-type ATPase [Thermodesulfobacteriota bacterium]